MVEEAGRRESGPGKRKKDAADDLVHKEEIRQERCLKRHESQGGCHYGGQEQSDRRA